MPVAGEFAQSPTALAGQGENHGPQIQSILWSQCATKILPLTRGNVVELDFGHFGPASLQLLDRSGDFGQNLALAAHEMLKVLGSIRREDGAAMHNHHSVARHLSLG